MSTTCNETSARARNTGLLGAATERILRPVLPTLRAIANRPARVHNTVMEWIDRDRERRALRELSDHMLKDIGISRCDVHREATKYFWRK